MNRLPTNALMAILITLLLTACGGGGGSSSNTSAAIDTSNSAPQTDSQPDPESDTGAGDVVVSTGIITGFGSVFVNGVEFETDGANVSTDDDTNATEDDLQVGMVVMLKGTVNEDGVTGQATDIEYEEEIQGVVEEVNPTDETFTVLGQLVRIDELTNFEGLTFDSMEAGQLVEVSGLVDADGNVLASLVKLEDMDDESNQELKVEGTISNFDAAAQTFQLNGLIVDFSTAEIEHGTSDDLGDDVVVRVKSSSDIVDGVLLADKIVIKEQGDDGEEGDPIVIDGVIDSFESPENFTVNGHQALVNDATNYLNGSSIDDLALNLRLRIKGVLDSDGVIVVDHLTLQTRHFLGMEGEIEAVDLVEGTLTMLGYIFQVNEDTHFIDSGKDRIRYFGLSDLLVGDRIEIKAAESTDETIYIAVKIKRHHDRDSDKIKLSGPVSEIDIGQARFLIDGFLIQLSEDTEIAAHNRDALDLITFFEMLEEGFTVKIEGYIDGDMVIAVEVGLKKNPDKGNDDDDGEEGEDKNGNNGKGNSDEKNGNGNGKDKDKDKDDEDDKESDDSAEDSEGDST